MIASLRGILIDQSGDRVVIEAGGVGYAVTVTATARDGLAPVGSETRLHIHTHATQDGPMQLFGFADLRERHVFELLIGVQGVGPRLGLVIVSALPMRDLVRALGSSDVARLTQIRGVGRKLGERLGIELRDKVLALAAGDEGHPGARPGPPGKPVPEGPVGEVYRALVALGYKPPEFETILPTLDPAVPIADLVKQALAALRRR
jgi:Holliday junction DNA helicase RuvA